MFDDAQYFFVLYFINVRHDDRLLPAPEIEETGHGGGLLVRADTVLATCDQSLNGLLVRIDGWRLRWVEVVPGFCSGSLVLSGSPSLI
jgi:hypothetical protein